MFAPMYRDLLAEEAAFPARRQENVLSQPNTGARVDDPPPKQTRLLYEGLHDWQQKLVHRFLAPAEPGDRHINWVRLVLLFFKLSTQIGESCVCPKCTNGNLCKRIQHDAMQ